MSLYSADFWYSPGGKAKLEEIVHSIVQAEFFRKTLSGEGAPLENVLGEYRGHIMENLELALRGIEPPPAIKFAVRFYDTCNSITPLALKIERCVSDERTLYSAFGSSRGLRRWLIDRRGRRLARKIRRLRTDIKLLTIASLRASLFSDQRVAVENMDRSFRAVRDDERHELAETIGRCRDLQLFLFLHENLLADKNTLIASVQ